MTNNLHDPKDLFIHLLFHLGMFMPTIQTIWHRNAYRIGIFFGFDDELKLRAKQAGASWSRTHRCWYVDYNAEKTRKIKEAFPDHKVVKNPDDNSPTPAPGLKNTHDTAPIVALPQAGNAFPLPGAAEHNPPHPWRLKKERRLQKITLKKHAENNFMIII